MRLEAAGQKARLSFTAMNSQVEKLNFEQKIKRIEPPRVWKFPNFREVWKYREMILIFIWRDFTIRYKQTLLGTIWVVISPLITMVVFTVFFGGILKVPSDGIP